MGQCPSFWGEKIVLVKLKTTLQPSLNLAYLHRCFWFNKKQKVQACTTPWKCFLSFLRTLSLDFLEMNCLKIVLVIILGKIMSEERFICWGVDHLFCQYAKICIGMPSNPSTLSILKAVELMLNFAWQVIMERSTGELFCQPVAQHFVTLCFHELFLFSHYW